jgi:hypothetical protein
VETVLWLAALTVQEPAVAVATMVVAVVILVDLEVQVLAVLLI